MHGFLELVERECASVWWYNRIRTAARRSRQLSDCRTSARSVICIVCSAARSRFSTSRSTDSIPSFVALSLARKNLRNDYTFGFGAHFDAQIAITKAVTEMTQVSARGPRGSRSRLLSAAGGRANRHVLPDAGAKGSRRPRSDFSPHPPGRCDTTRCFAPNWQSPGVWRCWSSTKRRKDLDMPVVKVVAPGMRSWWARFAPGRLYTLPVQAGWLARPKTELELNPDHLIL